MHFTPQDWLAAEPQQLWLSLRDLSMGLDNVNSGLPSTALAPEVKAYVGKFALAAPFYPERECSGGFLPA